MYEILESGEYDSVATRRVTRKGEPVIRSFFARLYYKIINKISKTEIVDGARDFRLMTRQMVNAVLKLKNIIDFLREFFLGLVLELNGLNMKMSKEQQGRLNGLFGNYFCIH